MNRPYIPDAEFAERARRLQEIMKREGVDILLAYGNEAEPQYARYLCDYWPSFESTGVLLAQTGDPILLIGPESYTFAKDRSRIPTIRRLAAFRESSDPEYPGEKLETFAEVIAELGVTPKTVAIAGYTLIFNSRHLALAEHKPFDRNRENTPKVTIVEKMKKRVMVADTDTGRILKEKIADLNELVAAYRGGIIKEKLE